MNNENRAPELPLFPSVDDNISWLLAELNNPADIVIRKFELLSEDNELRRAALCYFDGLADRNLIHEFIMVPLMETIIADGDNIVHAIEKRIMSASNVRLEIDRKVMLTSILSAGTIVFVNGETIGFCISTEGWEHRQIEKPVTEPIIRGPQDAFIEVMRMNTALLRRRIKDSQLVIDPLRLGSRSKTDVAVVYLKDAAHPSIVKEVKRRLNEVEIEALFDGGQLEEYIEDNPLSPFPQIGYTERVDKTAAGVIAGKVAILIDGSPHALLVPSTFADFVYSTEDYYNKAMSVTFLRLIRLLALFMAVFLPALYIAISTFHQEMLPSKLMVNIAANRTGVPFPAFFEAFIMEVSLELLREASLRLPGTMGQTIGIVGALVIGQAAVDAGLVGPILTIIVSFTAIGSFVVPSYPASLTIRLVRFPFMILAAIFGFYGIVFGASIVLIHLISLYSFGVSYMAAFTPQSLKDINDSIILKKTSNKVSMQPKFLRKIMTTGKWGGKRS